MGGFGSGGHRTGAGRKKKAKHLRLIDGGADRRGASVDESLPPPPAASTVPVEPPPKLTEAALEFWRRLAPAAHAAGTLTAMSCDSFGELCEIAAAKHEMLWRFQVVLDPTNGQPRALLRMSMKDEMACRREYRNLSRELHQRMKDFRLAPFGKELVPAGGAPAADPLDAFA